MDLEGWRLPVSEPVRGSDSAEDEPYLVPTRHTRTHYDCPCMLVNALVGASQASGALTTGLFRPLTTEQRILLSFL